MIQQTARVWTEKNQDRSSGFQSCNAGVLIENPSHIQEKTGRKISTWTCVGDICHFVVLVCQMILLLKYV